MRTRSIAIGLLVAVCASATYADTAGVPTNSVLAMAADNSGDDNANAPDNSAQDNNSMSNNTAGNNTSSNPLPDNYNPPVEYVVPLNPAHVRGQTTVNVQGSTGMNRTGANPEGAGR